MSSDPHIVQVGDVVVNLDRMIMAEERPDGTFKLTLDVDPSRSMELTITGAAAVDFRAVLDRLSRPIDPEANGG